MSVKTVLEALSKRHREGRNIGGGSRWPEVVVIEIGDSRWPEVVVAERGDSR